MSCVVIERLFDPACVFLREKVFSHRLNNYCIQATSEKGTACDVFLTHHKCPLDFQRNYRLLLQRPLHFISEVTSLNVYQKDSFIDITSNCNQL